MSKDISYEYKGLRILWDDFRAGWQAMEGNNLVGKPKPTQAEVEKIIDQHLKVIFERLPVYIASDYTQGEITSQAEDMGYKNQIQYWVSFNGSRGKIVGEDLYPVTPDNTLIVNQIKIIRAEITRLREQIESLHKGLTTVTPDMLIRKGE